MQHHTKTIKVQQIQLTNAFNNYATNSLAHKYMTFFGNMVIVLGRKWHNCTNTKF